MLTDEQINEAYLRYQREYDRYKKLAEVVFQKCQDIIQNNLTIRATVQGRAKNPNSFREKLKKEKARQKYSNVDEIFNNMSDLAGVRIITYLESDREIVVAEVKKQFIGKTSTEPVEVDKKDGDSRGAHYRATHCQVYLPEEYLDKENKNLKGTTCEIQVCSLLAHVFNEIEHDLQYKPLSGKLSEVEEELLDQLGLVTKAGDITIKRVLEATDERLRKGTGEFSDVHDFVTRMKDDTKLTEFSLNAGQLYDEIIHLKLNSPESIKSLLGFEKIDNETIKKEFEDLVEYVNPKQLKLELNKSSSDVLLVAILSKKLEDVIANHPTGRGFGRPTRLASIARAYKDMKDSKTPPKK